MLRRICTLVSIALSVAACSPDSPALPSNVRGVTHIDDGTDYVYLYERSTVGGACEGWNALAISKPGDYYSGIRNVVCWKEEDGVLHVNAEKGGTRSAPTDQMLDVGG